MPPPPPPSPSDADVETKREGGEEEEWKEDKRTDRTADAVATQNGVVFIMVCSSILPSIS